MSSLNKINEHLAWIKTDKKFENELREKIKVIIESGVTKDDYIEHLNKQKNKEAYIETVNEIWDSLLNREV